MFDFYLEKEKKSAIFTWDVYVSKTKEGSIE
jgi:hypothetical protein